MYVEYLVKTVEYGTKTGALVVYFHGAPGAIKECAVFDKHAQENNLRIVSLDRFAVKDAVDQDCYYQQIASQIKRIVGDEPLDIIGFSIGTHVALEVGAILRNQVRNIHLISSVAPLHKGDFIDHMAGGSVFTLAKESPVFFKLLTFCQKVMAMLAPSLLVRLLFASATGQDRELIKQPEFISYITSVIKHCFQAGTAGYMRDIKQYVTWPGYFDAYTSNVQIWHGTDDNWSPFSMATTLKQSIPGETKLEAMQGLSHYSCLFSAAPKICTQLRKAS